MKKILSLFVKYPFYGKIFIVIFLFAGLFSVSNMTKASFPVVESRIINVSVAYQGATPKEMEEGIVSLLENSIRGVVGIKEHSSTSQENAAALTITIKNGYDVDKVLYDVKNAIDGISNFPQGAERPVVSKVKTTTLAVFVSLTSKSGDLINMRNEAVAIEDDWMASGNISQIQQFGLPTRLEMSIEVDEEQLQRYNLTHSQVTSAVSAYNVDIYGGVIKSPVEQIKINIRNRSVDPKDIENIVVFSSEDGTQIKIKDVAKVDYRFEDAPRSSYRDGDRNIMFKVDNLKEEDLQKTSEFINQYIEEYNAKNEDMQLHIIRDFLDILDGQLGILYGNGIQGILLVIVVLSLFLNFRISLWVAWGIPASFLGMFIVASMAGISLNLISLFGMILIIGILVDDGIVIGENIFTYAEKGYSPKVAAIKGTLEVLPSVVVSVLTTIVAFMPLLFIEGSLEVMYEMAFVVIFCLLFSVIEGMFILPGHLASKKALDLNPKKSWYTKVRDTFDKIMSFCCNKIYLPYLRWSLSKKVVILAISTALMLITAGLFLGGRLKFTFFPPSNEDNFSIDVALKPGTSAETTLAILEDLEVRIHKADSMLAAKYDEPLFIESYNRQVGSSFSGNESGEHAGLIRVFLRGLDDSKIGSDIVKKAIADEIPSIPSSYKFAVGASTRFGAPVSISLFSRNNETLEKASNELQVELSKLSVLYNVMDNNQLGTREVHLKLKPLAYSLNLTPQAIMSQVRSAFYGSLAQRIQEGRNEIWFYVRYPESNSTTIADLEKLMIRTPGGEYPLSQLCDYNIARGVTKINHFNGKKEIRVDAFMLDPSESVLPVLEEVSNSILPNILDKYPGLTYMYQGQVKDSNENMSNIAVMFSLAFAVMVLILVIYFRSFMQGFLIMSMVPLSFMAAIWGHLFEGVVLSMMSIWGMIALSGTIINNAVVFMACYNGLIKDGMKVYDAIIESGRARFRPIILTSITTIAGLFPLIKETSSESAFVRPMAISLGYGILIGTIFILALYPALLKCANIAMVFTAKLFGNKEATPESVETAYKDAKVTKELAEELGE